jgi:hypothetical protein
MFCESFRETLSEAAMRGDRLPAEVQAHLAACASCRASFSGEQALFDRIAAEVRSSVNAEVPASLLPRVRQRIAAAPATETWRAPVLAYVASGLAIGAIALSLAVRTQVRSAKPEPPASRVSSPGPDQSGAPAKESGPGQGLAAIHRRERRAPQAISSAAQEVLVSGEEQLGLERYAASLRNTATEPAASVKSDAVLEIKPLEIAGMDLKGLSIDPLETGDRD